MNLKYFSLLFSIIGVLALYFLSMLSKPSFIEIHQIPEYEGKQITTQGIVIDYQTTKYGSQIITIEDNNATTKVFVEGTTDIEYGDKIQVTGEIQKYKDEWEIIVNDKKSVNILEKWRNISIPISQLAQNPTKYLGLNVNVTGFIETTSNSYFNLVDLEEKYSLITFYNLPGNFTLYPGRQVNILGRFSFDYKQFRYKLEISDENHEVSYKE